MPLYPRTNFAIVQLNAGITAGATAMTLSTGHGARLPAPGALGFFLTIWNDTDYPSAPQGDPAVERVKVTALSGDSITTMVRGQDGTSAVAHNTADKIYKAVLAWGKAEVDRTEAEIAEALAAAAAAQDTGDTALAALISFGAAQGLTNTEIANSSKGINFFDSDADTVFGAVNIALPSISGFPVAAYTAGLTVRWINTTANAGALDINVNSIGAVDLFDERGAELVGSELTNNQLCQATFDGTAFRLLGIRSGT